MSLLDSADSRTRKAVLRPMARKDGVVLFGQPVYCTSCGKHDGYVTVGLPDNIVYACPDCEAKYGDALAGLKARPDLDEERVSS